LTYASGGDRMKEKVDINNNLLFPKLA